METFMYVFENQGLSTNTIHLCVHLELFGNCCKVYRIFMCTCEVCGLFIYVANLWVQVCREASFLKRL